MLTSKQRSQLKKMAHDIQPIIQVGKAGLNENLIKQVDDALESRELIKGTVLNNSPINANEATKEICEKTNAEAVIVVGSKFVLYRQSVKNSSSPVSSILRG